MKKVTLDLEWDVDSQKFRLGAVTNGKTVTVYDTLPAFVAALQKLPKNVVIGGHYVISDLGMLVKWGQGHALPQRLVLDDSLIAARLLYNHAPTKDLKTLAAEHGMKYQNLQKEQVGPTLTEEDYEYCAKDTWASHYLTNIFTQGIDSRTQAVLDLNNRFQLAFFAVELAGLKFDLQKAAAEERRIVSSLSELVPQLPVGLAPSVVTNDNELREWLLHTYSEDELKLFPKTSTGELSVGVDYLKVLARKPDGFDALLKARELQGFLSLYVTGKQRFLDTNHFLYPSYKLLIAKTHRRSTVPAIQNWPKAAREFIIPRCPKGQIVWGDFKQLEARLFAWQCKSKKMLQDLIERGYLGIASRVYGIDIERGSEEYKLMKATILASQYNMGAGKLRLKILLDFGIDISFREAQDKLDKLFSTYPEMVPERERRIKYAWDTGTTWSDVGAPVPLYLLPPSYYPPDEVVLYRRSRVENGRKVWYEEEHVKVPWEVKQIHNFSINYPTQQLAGYVTGSALLSMQEALAEEHGGWGEYLSLVHDSTKMKRSELVHVPIAEVHDELVADSRRPEETKEFMRHHMTHGLMRYLKVVCPYFDCPLDVDLEAMPHWSKT